MKKTLDSPLKIPHIGYPWFGCVFLLAALAYLLLANNPTLIQKFALTGKVFSSTAVVTVVLTALLVWLLDLRHFYTRREKYLKNTQALKTQMQDLIENKRQLQRKAHTSSSQTEKLKAFIGDRLLEYIEYDEKFLHFKGIAAEVRHNGIICYDKILNALKAAETTEPENAAYPDALTSLSYLWDLLDLSTADNIALHINNHICECEEYFYQIQLQKQHPNSDMEPVPYTPTFFAHHGLLRALLPLMETPYTNTIQETENALIHTEPNSQFQFHLTKNCQLLGNENHLVLIIENLVKNALYYGNKAKTGSKHSRRYNKVSLALTRDEQSTQISVYNHGPHIPTDIAEQIYQLGYTTRRAKDVHGKGLGLYFVQQIVTGYEGKISHKNICNQPESYSLRLELEGAGFEGNDIQTKVIETTLADNSIGCLNKTLAANDGGNETPLERIDWSFKRRLVSIEITAHSNGRTFAYSQLILQDKHTFMEPGLRYAPRWAIEVINHEQGSQITFLPLDVTGVEFLVKLPLAQYQFEQSEEQENKLSEEYISDIESRFRAIDAQQDEASS